MKKNLSNLIALLVLIFVFNGISAGEDIEKYQDLVDKVSQRLIASINTDGLKLKFKFHPKFVVQPTDHINAFTFAFGGEYIVQVTTQLMKDIIQGKEDRLAYILSHELSHITCGHVDFGEPETTNKTIQQIFIKEDEFEADSAGFQLMVKAGFSHTGARESFMKMRELSGDYSSIEANALDHPSFTERLVFIDKEKENIWRAMSSFTTGVELLHFEQYEAATVCFEKVIDEFPDCYEALNNLGYATLMRYFDKFDLEDLKKFNIGQIVVGGFYRRPASLEAEIKGFDEELFWKAVGYFKDALRIKPNLSLVKANLGVAYLLDPRQKSRGDAEKYLTEAIELVESDTTIDPLQKAVIYINAGNLGLAALNFESTTQNLNTASDYMNSQASDNKLFAGQGRGITFNRIQIKNAISFNRYLVKTKNYSEVTDTTDVVNFLLKYLERTDKSSIWWEYSYDLYVNLCQKNGTKHIEESKIRMSQIRPPAVSIVLQDGTPIYLSQKISEINSKLKYTCRIPIVEERKIYRYVYSDLGIEIVGGEYVVEIIVKATEQSKNIKIPTFEKNKVDYSFWGLTPKKLLDKLDDNEFIRYYFKSSDDLGYVFCHELGIAYLIEENIVSGFMIVLPPRVD